MEATPLNHEILQTMHRFKRFNKNVMFGNLTRNEFFVLEIMQGHGPLCNHGMRENSDGAYVSELAAKLEVSPPAVSRMLKTMEKNGLVERVVDSYDRRNTCVTATAAGKAVCEQTRQHFASFTRQVIEQMGEQDIKQLLHLFNQLLTTMEQVSGNQKEGTPND